ncbi:unnamed protein product [Amoebophrya sp. A25]|nr:unnamed protein product [Amoebophrya sp. A25]|eukprot:GSA25T00013241001.1
MAICKELVEMGLRLSDLGITLHLHDPAGPHLDLKFYWVRPGLRAVAGAHIKDTKVGALIAGDIEATSQPSLASEDANDSSEQCPISDAITAHIPEDVGDLM